MLKIKSKVLGCFLMVSAIICVAAVQKVKLVRTKVNDKITVSVPQDWIPMDGMDFTQRYPSVRAPLAAFTNMERNVDFSVNISATQWPDGDLEMSKRFFKSSIMNMFDRVDFIDEGIREVNNKKFIVFEFESRIDGNRQKEGFKDSILKYSYIQYLVQPDRTLVFAFNSPRRLRDDWQENEREMMSAVKIK
jgi:hypothetical protein